MSTPYPPQAPRRLMRDPSNKLIGGVCAGLAKYLNMDVNLVRILTVLISLFTGVPIVLYIIALFVMPEERNTPPQPPYVTGPQAGAYGTGGYAGGQQWQQPTGSQPAGSQPARDDVWGATGAPWEQPQPAGATPPAAAPTPQSWQQSPSAQVFDPGQGEAIGYDTAPATAAHEEEPAADFEPEPVPETEAPRPAAEGTSAWESAPAEPATAAHGADATDDQSATDPGPDKRA